MEMIMILYSTLAYPGIIGGVEAGSLSILEGIFELIIAITIQLVIYNTWTYRSSRTEGQ